MILFACELTSTFMPRTPRIEHPSKLNLLEAINYDFIEHARPRLFNLQGDNRRVDEIGGLRYPYAHPFTRDLPALFKDAACQGNGLLFFTPARSYPFHRRDKFFYNFHMLKGYS